MSDDNENVISRQVPRRLRLLDRKRLKRLTSLIQSTERLLYIVNGEVNPEDRTDCWLALTDRRVMTLVENEDPKVFRYAEITDVGTEPSVGVLNLPAVRRIPISTVNLRVRGPRLDLKLMRVQKKEVVNDLVSFMAERSMSDRRAPLTHERPGNAL